MRTNRFRLLLAALLPLAMAAQVEVSYEAGLTANAGNNELAPHYIMANHGGVVTQQFSTLLHGGIWHTMDTTRRLSWGAGVEAWGGWASTAAYWQVNNSSSSAFPSGGDDPASSSAEPFFVMPPINHQRPANVWLQQAWVEGKYRGVQLVLGAKRHESPMVNDCLSSGDMVWSQNARPLVGARAGFVNFQTIPFTRGWVQINGEVGYYKPGDNKWLEHHYNYRNHFITTGWWMNYKYLHLRSNPNKPLVVTLGMQAAHGRPQRVGIAAVTGKEQIVAVGDSHGAGGSVQAIGGVEGQLRAPAAQRRELRLHAAPEVAYHDVAGGGEVHVRFGEAEARQHAFVVVAEDPLAVPQRYLRHRRFARQRLHARGVHALARHGLQHAPAICVRAHRADVRRFAAEAAGVHRHVHRAAAWIGRAAVEIGVIINAIAANGRELHCVPPLM